MTNAERYAKRKVIFKNKVALLQRLLDPTKEVAFNKDTTKGIVIFNYKEIQIHPRFGYKNLPLAVYYGFHMKEKMLCPTKMAKWLKKII